ncbi:transposase [Archangium lansingense]|uniref:transposase n=1 Tax=Archangium lansingense TaxID=2995310 RepID=UPI00358DA855
MRAQLAVREALVRTRTRYIALVSALVRREGLRVADGEAESFARRVAALALPGWLMAEVAPLLSLMQHLNEQIAFLNGVLERVAHKDEQVSRLCTVPQVGPVTACAFVSAVDEPARFSGPHQLEAYLGLVPDSGGRFTEGRTGPCWADAVGSGRAPGGRGDTPCARRSADKKACPTGFRRTAPVSGPLVRHALLLGGLLTQSQSACWGGPRAGASGGGSLGRWRRLRRRTAPSVR